MMITVGKRHLLFFEGWMGIGFIRFDGEFANTKVEWTASLGLVEIRKLREGVLL